MAELFTHPSTVEQMTGLSLRGCMLMPMQDHDRRQALPAVLSAGSQSTFLVRHIDTGNLAATEFSRMPVFPFSPYWTPSPVAGIPSTLADAVLARLGGERLTIDPATPAVVYEQLRAAIPVEVAPAPEGPVDAFKLGRADVLRRFNHHRRDVADIARRVTRSHPQGPRLERWLAESPSPAFDLLDRMAVGHGLSAILASWVTNFQELSGRRGELASAHGCAALFLLGTDEIWVLAPPGLELGLPGTPRRHPSLAQAVAAIAGQGQVGFELDTLEASRLLALRDRGVRLSDAGLLLRDWREEKAWYDIPYFVVGALASRHAIEGAAHFAGQAIRAGVQITERDVDRVYRALLREFESDHHLPVSLDLYFGSAHAGARTMLPSRPTDYRLSAGATTLKIDAGIFVVDDGLLHACTDQARTVTTTPAAREVFAAMEEAVVAETIPAILPEMTGEQIHILGVGKVADREEVFRTHGYMPDTFSWRTGYTRDIGHVIERQESYTFNFRPGVRRALHPGMVACVEVHCLGEGHNLTIEDTFIVDEAGPIVISRLPEEFGSDGRVTRYPRR